MITLSDGQTDGAGFKPSDLVSQSAVHFNPNRDIKYVEDSNDRQQSRLNHLHGLVSTMWSVIRHNNHSHEVISYFGMVDS